MTPHRPHLESFIAFLVDFLTSLKESRVLIPPIMAAQVPAEELSKLSGMFSALTGFF